MGEVFLDALIDSLIVLAFLVPINVIIAIAEPHLAGKIKLKGKAAPLIGVRKHSRQCNALCKKYNSSFFSYKRKSAYYLHY